MPDLARVLLDGSSVDARNTEGLQRNALAVKHPKDVVVGDDKECGGIRESFIQSEPGRIRVAVRTDDGQCTDSCIKAPRDLTYRGFRGE
jgi:hypothetical protein